MDLCSWLRSLGLEQYEAVFRQNAIDDMVLPDLTEEHLREIGVPLGARIKLLKAIAALNERTETVVPLSIGRAERPVETAERRQLTVMFSDLVGSTAMAGTMDPEDLREVISAYQKCAAETVRRFDGCISRYMGDGVLVYFGYPKAHEDDAERAVRAGLELISALAGLKINAPLQTRIGIATGLVVVGDVIGSGEAQERGAVGETPNLAARLQGIAEPDTIVIAENTRRLLGNLFDLTDLGPKKLKGIAERVRAWTVLRSSSIESRFEALHAGHLSTLVGREEEMDLLLRRWSRAKTDEGEVVLLSGEAGIGKSRVVETFRQLIAETPHTTLHYQCSPHHADSPLYPVIAQIVIAAGIALDDSPTARLEKLEALVKRSTDRWDELIPLLAALLSIPTTDRYPPPDPDPQRRRERTLAALIEQLQALARQSALLVILEDAHWADPTTLDLFGRIIVQFPKLRGFLIVTYRPEFKFPWDHHPNVTALSLNRLGRRDCKMMVEAITRGKTLPSEVMEQIVAKTDGIPLFVEELTKTVLESGLLKEQDSTFSLAGLLPPLAIPATLQDSLMARLDRLSTVKEVAQIGAAIGREFFFDLLAAVCSMQNSDLQDALAKLEAAELIFSHGTPPNTSYIFKHALVQDAAYETLLKSRRHQLHARIAGVLETRFAEVAAAQPEIVAHHYTNAGLAQVAVDWWRKAGEIAIKRSANLEAVRHLNRAIDQVQLCPESRERDINELAIRISLSGPLIATRGYVTAELANNYARASKLCTKLGEDKSKFPVMYGQWVIPYVRGDMAAALRNSEIFLRRAEQQDDGGLLMMGHRIFGSSLVWRGDVLPGSQHLQHALSLFQSPEHDHLAYMFSQHPRTAALAHLCLALQHLGHLDQAMEAGWEAISQAKRIEHFNSIAYALCFVSLLIMLRRDVGTLKQTAGELLQLASQHNASYWLLWAKPMMGWIAAQEGETEAGIAQMHESTAELQRQQANLWVPQTLLLEAEILGQAKQYGRAYQLLDEAQALIEPLDQRFYEAELHRVRGVIMISDSADLTAGVASLDRAIDVARRQNARFLELRAKVTKARFLVDHGLHADACNLLAPIYGSFAEGLDTVDLREARSLLDSPR